MATLTIRNLPDEVRDRLRVRAAEHGRSMEEEARRILDEALGKGAQADRHKAIRDAQAYMRSLPGYDPNRRLSDELIADRRAEAAREEAQIQAWLKRGK